MKKYARLIIIGVLLLSLSQAAYASNTDGTIDAQQHYAWSKDFGWFNFLADQGNIHVTDSGLTGYAWNTNIGWLNLNPDSSRQGVANDSEGHLSGYAWNGSLGWFNFSGVSIDSQGVFHGVATNTHGFSITFNCDTCAVKTDWRPQSVRPSSSTNNSGSSSAPSGYSGGSHPIATPTPSSLPLQTTPSVSPSASSTPLPPPASTKPVPPKSKSTPTPKAAAKPVPTPTKSLMPRELLKPGSPSLPVAPINSFYNSISSWFPRLFNWFRGLVKKQ